MRIKYCGKLLGSGGQIDLEIIYRDGGWVANILVEVGAKPSKSNRRGYVEGVRSIKRNGGVVERNPGRIRQRDPWGGHKGFIDVGLTNYSLYL